MTVLSYSHLPRQTLPRRRLWLTAALGAFLLAANAIILTVALPGASFPAILPRFLATPAIFLLFPLATIAVPFAGVRLLQRAVLQRRTTLLVILVLAFLSLVSSGMLVRDTLRIWGGFDFSAILLLYLTAPGLIAAASLLFIVLILTLLQSPQPPEPFFDLREYIVLRYLEEICRGAIGPAIIAFTLYHIVPRLQEIGRDFRWTMPASIRSRFLWQLYDRLTDSGLMLPILLAAGAVIPTCKLVHRLQNRINPPAAANPLRRTVAIYLVGAALGSILTYAVPSLLPWLLTRFS